MESSSNPTEFAPTQLPSNWSGSVSGKLLTKEDRAGQQFGNYRLLRLLAEGGFAEVYQGEHVHLNTNAAIKILHARLGSEELEQFSAEARIVARLRHPHIVSVLDFAVQNSIPFLVMDFAPNGNLRQRHLRGSVIPPDTILLYLKQIADALQYAHHEHLIHRDIKPEEGGRKNCVVFPASLFSCLRIVCNSSSSHPRCRRHISLTAPR